MEGPPPCQVFIHCHSNTSQRRTLNISKFPEGEGVSSPGNPSAKIIARCPQQEREVGGTNTLSICSSRARRFPRFDSRARRRDLLFISPRALPCPQTSTHYPIRVSSGRGKARKKRESKERKHPYLPSFFPTREAITGSTGTTPLFSSPALLMVTGTETR